MTSTASITLLAMKYAIHVARRYRNPARRIVWIL